MLFSAFLIGGLLHLASCSIADNAEWHLQAANVCYNSKDDQPGVFAFKQDGVLYGLSLEHVSGKFTSCVQGSDGEVSRWGCWDRIHTAVSDSRKDLLFPVDPVKTLGSNYHYFQPGYNAITSDYLTWLNFNNPIYAHKGMELSIWHLEDMYNYTEGNNEGRHCVNVYAKFTQ